MAAFFDIAAGRTGIFRAKSNLVPSVPPATPYAWYAADLDVTYDGSNNVTAWADQSGNNRTLYVPEDQNSPIFYESIINGMPSIKFESGMALYLDGDTTTIKSILSVVKTAESLSTYQCIVEAGGGGLYTVLSGGGEDPALFGSYWSGFVTYADVDVETSYILGVRTNDGEDTYGYRNDSSYNVSGNGFQGRGQISVGNDSSYGQAMMGYLSELILFDVALTEAQIQSYITTLNTKYGIY